MAEPWDSLRDSFPTNTEGLITAGTMRNQVDVLESEDSGNVKSANLAADMLPILQDYFIPFWKGIWTAGEYNKGDLVFDGGWLMIANKTTYERPAPQPVGDTETNYPVTPEWDTPNPTFTGQVWTGCDITFSKTGWLEELAVWLPETGDDITYQFAIADRTDPDNIQLHYLSAPALSAGSWNTIALGNQLVVTDQVLTFVISALKSASSTQLTGQWNYQGVQQTAGPSSQGWLTNQQETQLRMDKTDLASLDRTADLLGIVPGSTIVFADAAAPDTIYKTFVVNTQPLDEGTYIQWNVTLQNNVGDLAPGITDMDADVPVPAPTAYVEDAAYYPTAAQPSFGLVEGYKAFDGVPQTGVENYGYGFAIRFQEAGVSADWEVLASSQTSGNSTYSPTYDYEKTEDYTVPSTTYAEVARLTTPTRTPGTYEVKLSWTSTLDSTINSQFFQWSIDGGNTWNEFVMEPQDTSDKYPFTYLFPLEWAGGQFELLFQAKKENQADNMVIDFLDIIFERKP